jgi:hypothetical protein
MAKGRRVSWCKVPSVRHTGATLNLSATFRTEFPSLAGEASNLAVIAEFSKPLEVAEHPCGMRFRITGVDSSSTGEVVKASTACGDPPRA